MMRLVLAALCASAGAAYSGIEAADDPPSAAIAGAHPVYNWTVAMRDVHLYHFKTWGFHEGAFFLQCHPSSIMNPLCRFSCLLSS